jgi:signal transduction histidine kinase
MRPDKGEPGTMRELRSTAGVVLAVALACCPRAALAFDGSTIGTTVVPLAALAAVIGIWTVCARLRNASEAALGKERAALAEAKAALAIAPAACLRWDAEGVEHWSPGTAAGLAFSTPPRRDELIARFALEDAAALGSAIDALRRDGSGFAVTLTSAAGGIVDVVGRRATRPGHPPVDAVWLLDAGPRAALAADAADLMQERDRLRAVLDALPLPVWRRSRDLALVDCNKAYAAAVDATADSAIADQREIAAGVIAAAGKALADRAQASAGPQSESHHIVIGGARRLVEFSEATLAGADGEIIGFARDFTELENVQAELARHIAAHADVLENVATAVAIYGPDTRLKFFNTAFGTLWRLEEDWLATEPSLGEVLERLRERRRLPEYADFRSFKKQQLAMFTSLIEAQEELLHLPDERTLRLVVSTHPFGGLTFVYEDVTDRLALERSYNTLIEVQRETLDNLYEGIAVFGSDGRLKLSNPAYGQIWQLAPADLQGEPHVAEIVEKTRSFFDDGSDWATLKTRIISRVTAHLLVSGQLERQDGSVLQVSTVPLPDGNILLSYLDVTDSTRVQRALRERNEALETTGRLKSEFIANVSYELRTPLNAIIGFAEILTNQYFGELNPRQLDYSRGILDSSHRLLALINDILDLATIEAGYMLLETEHIDIHSLMASVLALTRERARKQNINLEFECAHDLGMLTADERRLKQALFNLISNAIKFTPSGGTIRLAARREGNEVALVVADNGAGIPSEQQARVFEKFERGNPQARQSGAGLGLSLVKSFVELHGGRVEMHSAPGAGTTVTLHLPLTAGATDEAQADPSVARA